MNFSVWHNWHLVAQLILVFIAQYPSSGSCQLRLVGHDSSTMAASESGEFTTTARTVTGTATGTDLFVESSSSSVGTRTTTQSSNIERSTTINIESNAIIVSEEPQPQYQSGVLNGSSSSYDVYNHPTIRKAFHLPQNYNKEMRPSKFNAPVQVEFEIHVQAINPIKAADMDFRMEVLFSFRWDDLRLDFDDDVFYDSDHILLPSEMIDSIWHPDPYILNAKSTEVGQLTGKLIKVYIFRNHTVVYSINLFVTVACAMQFQYYPFDYQLCPMIIESFSYDETKVLYRWSKYQKFTVNPRLRLLQFVVTYPLVAEECSIRRIKEDHNVSQLIAFFRFDRLLGNHLIQTFSPCSLVTALSWLSFWFELDAIPARVSLLITSLLILVTQFSGLKVDMPPVAYVKAVDIWMAGCMLFVFSALAEFVLVKIIYAKTEDLKHMIMNSHMNGEVDGGGGNGIGVGSGGGGGKRSDDDGTSSTSMVSSESSSSSSTSSSVTTASVRSSPLVTPSAISPLMKHNQVPQRVMSKENIGGSSSTFEFTSSQPQLHKNQSQSQTISHNPQPQPPPPHPPPPPITLIRSLSMNNPKLTSISSFPNAATHTHVHENIVMHTPRRIHAILNMKVPFCWGYLALPLIWTNEKTKTTYCLWKELDRISRWFFPVTFCLFLVVYWLVLFVHSRIYSPPSHYGTC